MPDEIKCSTCRKPISTEHGRFISAHSAPDDAHEYICRRCWLEELAEEAANECTSCLGTGGTMGEMCDSCDGTGKAD